MKREGLIIEKKEYVLLKRYINISNFYKDEALRNVFKHLSYALESALVCSENQMPKNSVRLNSIVTIVSSDGITETFQLVLPSEMTSDKTKMALFSPKGIAVIGRKEGDIVELVLANKKLGYSIANVKQENKNISLDMVI